MATKETDKQFQEIVEEAKQDEKILALWLDGSRGKGLTTKHSDYDAKIVVRDDDKASYTKKYKELKNPEIEIAVMTLNELQDHAIYGSDMAWDMYNFAHLTVLFDRTGKVQSIINSKSTLSEEERKVAVKKGLDGFINLVYRTEKNIRDGNTFAATLDAFEAIPLFLDAVFALEGKVRPYNKWLAWELKHYPLKNFSWKEGELCERLSEIVDKKRLHILHELFLETQPIFRKHGYNDEYNEWKGYYKVG